MLKIRLKTLFGAILLAMFAIANANNLLYNGDFSNLETLNEAQKKSLSDASIKCKSNDFPKYWFVIKAADAPEMTLNCTKNTGGKNIISFNTGAGSLNLGAYFYRIPSNSLSANETYKMTVDAKGNGTIDFGIYSYGYDGGFLSGTMLGKAKVENDYTTFLSDKLTKASFASNTTAIVPFLIIKGDVDIESVSLDMEPKDWEGPTEYWEKNIIYNPRFDSGVALTAAQKEDMKKNGIEALSSDFPSSWYTSSNSKLNNASVEYIKTANTANGNSIKIVSNNGDVILGGYFYRLALSSLNGNFFQFGIINAKGSGLTSFGFYCYKKGSGEYLGNMVLSNSKLTKNSRNIWSKPFDNSMFPDGTGDIVPYISIKGEMELSGVSICEISMEHHKKLTSSETVNPVETELSKQLNAKYASLDNDSAKLEFINSVEIAADALPFLIKICNSGDNKPAFASLLRIGSICEKYKPEISGFLIDKMSGRNLAIASAAIVAAGNMRDKGVRLIPYLAVLCKHNNERIRVLAINSLIQIGEKAVPAIKDLMLSDNKTVAISVATAVRGMPEIPAELKSVADWANPGIAIENGSLIPNYSFEEDAQKIPGWDFLLREQAAGTYEVDGTRSRTGLNSLKISKKNGVGYVCLRTSQKVTVPAGQDLLTYRIHFQASGASQSNLLLLRFEDDNGNLLWDDTAAHGGAGWQSQSILRNTPGHVWDTRMIMVRQDKSPKTYYLDIILYGNPCTVWIDDVEFPARTWSAVAAGPTIPQRAMSWESALKIIEKRAPVEASIEKVNGHAEMKINGKAVSPVLYMTVMSPFADYAVMENDANVKLQVIYINLFEELLSVYSDRNACYPLYPPVNTFKNDFSTCFKILEDSIRNCPGSNIVLGFGIGMPPGFVDQNPDEAWLDQNGQKVYGTQGHVQGSGPELRAGTFYWPSPFSLKAKEKQGKILKEFIKQLKEKPYSKIVAGVFICGGHDGQFYITQRDFSNNCKTAWRNFLREKYKTDENLAASWKKQDARINNAEIIPNLPTDKSGNRMFFSPSNYCPFADFEEFEKTAVFAQPEYYAKIVKDEIGHKIFAATWHMGGAWNGDFSYFLKSKTLDAIVAQPFYEYRYPGYSGGLPGIYETFSQNGKLVIKELDTRNWMRGITDELDTMRIATPMSKEHFKTSVFKEAGEMIAHYHGFWYYDIGSNAYRHPEALKIIRTTKDVADEVFSRMDTDKFMPDVAFIYSIKSLFWNGEIKFPNWSQSWLLLNLSTSGVPVAHYCLEDIIKNPDKIANAKVIVFLNTYYLTNAEKVFINKTFKRDGKFLVWHYAPGYLDENSINIASLSDIVGMNVETDEKKLTRMIPVAVNSQDPLSAGLKPLQGTGDSTRCFLELGANDYWHQFSQRFWINDPNTVTLAKYCEDGKSAIAVKRTNQYTSVYVAAVSGLSPELLNNIAKQAGAFVASEPGPVINMNSNFISIHGTAGGKYTIKLPRTADVYDPLSGQIIAKHVDSLELEIIPQKSYWFILR